MSALQIWMTGAVYFYAGCLIFCLDIEGLLNNWYVDSFIYHCNDGG